MDKGVFIAGDWGTSALRLYLCQGNDILETINGPGIGKIDNDFGNILFSLIKAWTAKYNNCPIYLSGMVGSNIGWVNTPYNHCPVTKDKICRDLTSLNHNGHDIFIVGGLACENPLGAPDLMRGEETQILGAMHLNQNLKKDVHTLCLPGTHTKWVLLKDGVIETFLTGLTGELYALLVDHSILIQSKKESRYLNKAAFKQGIERSLVVKNAQLLHILFEIRSKQIQQELEPQDAQDYLSGLLIGIDVSAMNSIFPADNPVTIIGSSMLTNNYSIAMKMNKISSIELDGGDAAVAGLRELYLIHNKKV